MGSAYMKKLGFIGMGNMAQALAMGFINAKAIAKENVYAYAPHQEKLLKNAETIGFTPVATLKDLARSVDTLVMACKPYQIEAVINELGKALEDKALISIAAGWDIAKYRQFITTNTRLQFIMPNTPAMVKEGMMGMCPGEALTDDEVALVRDLCQGFSKTELIAENLMDVVTAVSGSSPAYVFMFIEAMADAAVAGGMPRAQAYTFAAQAVMGSAKMVLETGKHPGELKDMVCSPAGTTIEAVRVLEDKGMRSAVIEAMMKCLDISRNM